MGKRSYLFKVVVSLLVIALSSGGTAEAFSLRSRMFSLRPLLSPARHVAAVPADRQPFLGANAFAISFIDLFSLGGGNSAIIVPVASSVSTTAGSSAPATPQAPATAGSQGSQAGTTSPQAAPSAVAAPPAPKAQSAFRFTPAELDLFARLVHSEASGEPFEGQVAVAASVLNRIRSPLYPNTLSAVINQVVNGHYQYSPVLDGRINQPANESARRAVQEALSGRDPSRGALGFYNPRKTSNQWVRSRPVTVTLGQHVFFR
jgi:spore germination cell wall hydrolase CwlJ-like protein